MVNNPFTQSHRIIDVQIPTPVFPVKDHLASAWIPPVTNFKLSPPSASAPLNAQERDTAAETI